MIHGSNPGHSAVGLTVGMTVFPSSRTMLSERSSILLVHLLSPSTTSFQARLPSPDSFPLCKLSFSSSFSTKGCKGVSASFWLQAAGSNKWGQTGGSWRSLVIARQSVVTAPQVGSWNSPHWSKSDFIPFSKSQFFSGCLFNRGSKLWNTCHCWYETIFKVMNISAHSQDLSLPTELSANRAILGAVWYPAESVNPCFAFLDAPVHPSRYQISIL